MHCFCTFYANNKTPTTNHILFQPLPRRLLPLQYKPAVILIKICKYEIIAFLTNVWYNIFNGGKKTFLFLPHKGQKQKAWKIRGKEN